MARCGGTLAGITPVLSITFCPGMLVMKRQNACCLLLVGLVHTA